MTSLVEHISKPGILHDSIPRAKLENEATKFWNVSICSNHVMEEDLGKISTKRESPLMYNFLHAAQTTETPQEHTMASRSIDPAPASSKEWIITQDQ